jgi:hypothetical protein
MKLPLYIGKSGRVRFPPPPPRSRSVYLDNEAFILRANSIDSLFTRQLSRRGDLRLCRSAPAASIPAPACFDRNDQFREQG